MSASGVVNNWRSKLQINTLKKKLDFEPQSPSVTGNVCYDYNTWGTGIYMGYMFDRNSRGKTSHIEWLFESNLRSFSHFKSSLRDLTRVGWAF